MLLYDLEQVWMVFEPWIVCEAELRTEFSRASRRERGCAARTMQVFRGFVSAFSTRRVLGFAARTVWKSLEICHCQRLAARRSVSGANIVGIYEGLLLPEGSRRDLVVARRELKLS